MYAGQGESASLPEGELELIRRIHEIHLRLPFFGSRKVLDRLQREGYRVSRKKVQRLMRLMDFCALYPRSISLGRRKP